MSWVCLWYYVHALHKCIGRVVLSNIMVTMAAVGPDIYKSFTPTVDDGEEN